MMAIHCSFKLKLGMPINSRLNIMTAVVNLTNTNLKHTPYSLVQTRELQMGQYPRFRSALSMQCE
jgi:hypothetical protein